MEAPSILDQTPTTSTKKDFWELIRSPKIIIAIIVLLLIFVFIISLLAYIVFNILYGKREPPPPPKKKLATKKKLEPAPAPTPPPTPSVPTEQVKKEEISNAYIEKPVEVKIEVSETQEEGSSKDEPIVEIIN